MIIKEGAEVQINGQKITDINKMQEVADKFQAKAQELEKAAQNDNPKQGLLAYIASIFKHIAAKLREKKEQPKENVDQTQTSKENKEDKPEDKKQDNKEETKSDEKDVKIKALEAKVAELSAQLEELQKKENDQPKPTEPVEKSSKENKQQPDLPVTYGPMKSTDTPVDINQPENNERKPEEKTLPPDEQINKEQEVADNLEQKKEEPTMSEEIKQDKVNEDATKNKELLNKIGNNLFK